MHASGVLLSDYTPMVHAATYVYHCIQSCVANYVCNLVQFNKTALHIYALSYIILFIMNICYPCYLSWL